MRRCIPDDLWTESSSLPLVDSGLDVFLKHLNMLNTNLPAVGLGRKIALENFSGRNIHFSLSLFTSGKHCIFPTTLNKFD